jgi:hypothetical protein
MTRLDQLRYQPDDTPDRLGRERLRVRPSQPEAIGVFEVSASHPSGKIRRPLARLVRRSVDLVVDVCDIDDEPCPVSLRPEKASEQREDQERPRVADVDPAVDGRSAGVDPDLLIGIEGDEVTAQRVLDPHLPHRCGC